MRHRLTSPRRDGQAVARVGPQRRAGHELAPGSVVARRRAASRYVARLDTRTLGEIALEVGGVQVDSLDQAASAQAQHYPIVTGAPAPPRLPPVAHVAGRSRHDQVQGLAEELIARGER